MRKGFTFALPVLVENLESRQLLAGVAKDLSFGAGGATFTNFGSYYDEVDAVTTTPDGKVIALGSGSKSFTVGRYLANGKPDTSFGQSGSVTLAQDGWPRDVEVQADGKILVAGEYQIPSTDGSFVGEGLMVARLNANGTLDATFGEGGYFRYERLAYVRRGHMVLQTDGKVLVSGFQSSFDGTGDNWLLLRLNTNGTLDRTFDGDGFVVRDFGKQDVLGEVALQSDGKIVGSGYQSVSSGSWTGLAARFNSDGSLDTTFGTGGSTVINTPMQSNYVAIQSTGRIVIVAFGVMAGLTSDGKLDPTFGTNGIVDFTPERSYGANSVDLQNDRIVIGGTYVYPDYSLDLVVYRFTANGARDTSFNGTGSIILDYGWDDERFDTAAIDSSGRIVLGGYGKTGDWLLARLTTDTATPPPTTGGTTLQSELATLSGGTGKATSHAGYTGTGYADYAGQNSAVTYSITRGSAGAGKLEFRYANGSTANRPLQVLVNNVVVGTVACAPTGGWTTWANVSLNNVALPAGNVVIKVLASTSAGGANVDSLTITASATVTPPPPPPPPTTGTDLALNKTTTASTIQASGNAAAKATDGSATTRWSSTYADNQWLQVDLGSANVITSVRLAWEAAFGKSYKIQGSNNASSWTDLYSTTTGDGGVDTINITNTTAWRYVRMLGLTRATKYGFSLFDFNVYGVGGTPPVEPPPVDPPPATTGSIGGFLFWDTNKNGKYDTGDTYQGGKVVFTDLDGDNVLDSNEKKLTTDAQGKFNFTGLAAGTYKVRRVVPSGYKVTTPAQDITITAGQIFSTVAIGTINA